MKFAIASLALAFALGCSDSGNGHSIVPCELQCSDFNGEGPVITVTTERADDCQPSFLQLGTLHLCFDETMPAAGGVNCYYDCPDPQP